MQTFTLTRKFQVAIPQAICKTLGLAPGDKVHMFVVGGRVQIIPVRPIKSMRGVLKRSGMQPDSRVDRALVQP